MNKKENVNNFINQIEISEISTNLKNPDKAKEIWKEFLAIIKENLNALSFKTWFEPIIPVDYDHYTLTIKIPNDYTWDFIEVHYNTLIKKALLKTIGEKAKLVYFYEENKNPIGYTDNSNNGVNQIYNVNINQINKTKVSPVIQKEESFETYLNEKFTFENFVKGDSNKLAYAGAHAVAESPGKTTFNPLFIYGGVGLGKTHLIQAIGNYVVQKKKVKRVLYTTAEKFTTEFVDSIRRGSTNEFTSFYKKIDLLIIDDIQFLAGKESTTDTFFHIFNSLHHLGKQIILTCDKPPKELSGLDERLISRFQWGLSVDIQPPDLETRIAILIKKCEAFNLEIDSTIIEYIAANITTNIRELEGTLVKLLAKVSLEGREINLDLAREVVKSIATEKRTTLTIEEIQRIVAEFFHLDINSLRAKSRKKEFVGARQIAMYFCKKYTNSSFKTIGLNFGGRDHSTVIHAIQSVEEAMKDDSFLSTIQAIQRKIEFSS